MFSTFLENLSASSTGVTLLITAISLIIGGFWTLLQFRLQVKEKRFSSYHDLIEKLVNPGKSPDGNLYLDQQIGVIYELRNYPDYFPVSVRMLNGLKGNGFWQKNTRLISELDLSVEYMTSNLLKRFFWRNFLKK